MRIMMPGEWAMRNKFEVPVVLNAFDSDYMIKELSQCTDEVVIVHKNVKGGFDKDAIFNVSGIDSAMVNIAKNEFLIRKPAGYVCTTLKTFLGKSFTEIIIHKPTNPVLSAKTGRTIPNAEMAQKYAHKIQNRATGEPLTSFVSLNADTLENLRNVKLDKLIFVKPDIQQGMREDSIAYFIAPEQTKAFLRAYNNSNAFMNNINYKDYIAEIQSTTANITDGMLCTAASTIMVAPFSWLGVAIGSIAMTYNMTGFVYESIVEGKPIAYYNDVYTTKNREDRLSNVLLHPTSKEEEKVMDRDAEKRMFKKTFFRLGLTLVTTLTAAVVYNNFINKAESAAEKVENKIASVFNYFFKNDSQALSLDDVTNYA